MASAAPTPSTSQALLDDAKKRCDVANERLDQAINDLRANPTEEVFKLIYANANKAYEDAFGSLTGATECSRYGAYDVKLSSCSFTLLALWYSTCHFLGMKRLRY
jgi:hypothetical protein